MRFTSVADLERFRAEAIAARPPHNKEIILSADSTCCILRGSLGVAEALKKEIASHDLGEAVGLRLAGCLGFCEIEPMVVILPQRILYQRVKPEDVSEIIERTIQRGEVIERLLYTDPATKQAIAAIDQVPFYQKQMRLVLGPNESIEPTRFEDYVAAGGYSALAKVLSSMTPEAVIEEMKRSGLRGRGGAGYPAGRKWESAAKAVSPDGVRYIICNADEGDPGAYMDRAVLEANPHSVIEGMIIGSFAIGSHDGYFYVRTEYPLAVEHVKTALAQAEEHGLLGENILGSGHSFSIKVVRGAGAFVCGESTALMASIEGRVGRPRAKYVHATDRGLHERPTNLNNVETWATVPLIVNKGADWFSRIGTGGSKGTKIFSLVGKINNTGLVEVPMGIALRDIIFAIGGGVPKGKRFKAVQTGGPSGGCIPESLLDLPVDYEELTKAGSMMGSGGMIVMDEDTCMVDTARYFLHFLKGESCGKCVPCREGIKQALAILERITRGEGREEDIATLEEIGAYQVDSSLCALGQSASNPVLSTIRYFRNEYETHIRDHYCPSGVCKSLFRYLVNAEACTGCMACKKVCPVNAVEGERKLPHLIKQDLCIKCGACYDACRFNAIERARNAVAGGDGMSTLTMTIDGREVQAERGQTILEAAKAKGIGIPTLCDHPTVEAYGACRMCLVEISVHGRKRLVTSCNYEAADGLVVETSSERVRRSRRMTIELLLARCPEVAALQRLAKVYQVESRRFPIEKDDCILCGLCVRVCRERMGVGAADFVGRGAEMRVDTPYERKSEACITCGACTFVCPTGSKRLDKVFPHKLAPRPSEFDMGMRPRSTVYIPFPQALPNVPVIDRENCVHFRNGACGVCAEVCPPKAIDYEQQDEVVRVETGAVILAPGFCLYDPVEKPEYSYGLAPNVLSSLQFERLLSASGPCTGNVVRPSDGKVPKRIAFVQCVGSRDETHEWCSSVCCMYSLKEAIIAKEHEHDVECTLFYMDIRAHGKGFDAYYERAKEMGIRFVRCRPSRIDELESKSLRVGFVPEDESGAYRTEDFDLVVLASGLQPPAEARALAAKFGIALDANRFGASPAFNPVASSRPGVFLAGPFSEPKDIPETVVEASSAAAEAMTLLAERRGTLVTKVDLPAETNIAGQVPRIGVFVCHCGKNIGAYVDVPAVREYAKTLPFVAFAMDNLYTCSSDAQVIIKSKIVEHRLNRVVVASCSPRTHEPLFQQTIREQGLNVHLFEMANIRDQCSWVHMDLKREATEKSKDLVRMAVAKSRLTEPLHAQTLPVTRAALVVGGGAAGMSAALTLADQGYDTFLVEKSPRLGGVAAGIERNLAGHAVADHVAGLTRRVSAHPRVKVFTDSHLDQVEGFVGNFETTIASNPSNGRHGPARERVKVKHGAAVLAVGAGESRPTEYLCGENPAVVTLLELERRVAAKAGVHAGTVVFIQCVGSREADHLYCSRTCCATAIKQAIRLKELSPDTNVLVLYRDIRTYGFREKAYERARELGVAFIRYDLDRKPVVAPRGKNGGGGVTVTVRDPILGANLAIPADLLVLSARVDANPDNERLSQLFKIPLNAHGFFLEAHAKLRPVDFATEGVFVCGSAHYPKDTTEAIAQAKAAAARAATVLARESIEAEGKTSFVRESRCEACGACVEVCPYHAVEIDPVRNKAKVNDALCKGCGICAATCRSSAIDLKGFRDEQIMAVLKTVVTI